MKKSLRPIALLLLSSPVFATVQINANRIIYHGEDSDAKIEVTNKEQREYLIQSWIDDNQQSHSRMPFIVTPPLFKMSGNSENVVQVIYGGHGLPADQESLYWLDVKAIPAMTDAERSSKDKIVVAVVNRLKLIYRPAGLTGNPQQAVEKLQWNVNDKGEVIAKNNSPYYVILNKIIINNHEIPVDVTTNNTVIAPFSSKDYSKATGKVKVDWAGMNDYGVASSLYSITVN